MKVEKGGKPLIVVVLKKDNRIMYVFRPKDPNLDYMAQGAEIAYEFFKSGNWKMLEAFVV